MKESKNYIIGGRNFDFAARTFIMGVVNVTPDSFSDGGKYFSTDSAVEHALQMIEDGADIVDVGGESTRPRDQHTKTDPWPISAEEELRRVAPVIEKIHHHKKDAVISIDTFKAIVADSALTAGATMVNDISGFHFDPDLSHVVAKHRATVVLMHTRGTPLTMQDHPEYGDLIEEIKKYLSESVQIARDAGVVQIILDPGIGFGKTVEHNLKILAMLSEFHVLCYPILVGPSRKSFIGRLTGAPIEKREAGTAAAVACAILNGANIVRVHDVKYMKDVCVISDAIRTTMGKEWNSFISVS